MDILRERPLFYDRSEAGKCLVARLSSYHDEETVILAIPRGGVPFAKEVADRLGSQLGVVIPRKITIPDNPEAGYGAVTEGKAIITAGLLY